MRILLILALNLIFAPQIIMAKVNYKLNFTEKEVRRHQVEVVLTIDAVGHSTSDFVHFKVPVWTPGSYKVREFSQHFEVKSTEVNGAEVDVERENKNTWLIPAKAKDQVKLTYMVYAFEQSVRQSYIDEFYAFLHGVSAFGYIEENSKDEIVLEVNALSKWKDVFIAAPAIEGRKHTYKLSNYDLLADSPIALGNFDVTFYESGSVPHSVVMIGKGNYDLLKIRDDFKKISDEEVKIFGSHPSEQYIHFIYNVNKGGGGLEHLNCQTSMYGRFDYKDETKYKKFLGLISHEYFHLWNVKRIAPKELGPFDYDKENYTDLLWVAEGFTSYYDDQVLLRAGLIDQKEYLELVAAQITRFENTPGKRVMTLEESSRLAWIKAYLPHENSNNTTISYYNKGMLAAMAMDLRIRSRTKGEKSLDDLLKLLFERFDYKHLQDKTKGYDIQTLVSLCEDVLKVEMKDLLDKLVYTTDSLDYGKWFSFMDVKLEDQNDHSKRYLGVTGSFAEGRYTISKVITASPAEVYGLSVNDEIIAVNDWRVDSDINDVIQNYDIGEKVDLVVSRDGKLNTITIELIADPEVKYALEVKNEKNEWMKQWLSQD